MARANTIPQNAGRHVVGMGIARSTLSESSASMETQKGSRKAKTSSRQTRKDPRKLSAGEKLGETQHKPIEFQKFSKRPERSTETREMPRSAQEKRRKAKRSSEKPDEAQ